MKNKKNQKLLLYGTAGLLAAFLLYRLYSSRRGQASTAATPDQAAADYASLAGTEQADIAGLQSELGTIQSSLSAAPSQSDLAALQATETADIAGLAGQITGLGTALGNLPPGPAGPAGAPGHDAVATATGHKPPHKHPIHKPPKHAPKGSVWGGPVKPKKKGVTYHGIGGGWWAPTKTKPKHNDPHSSAHQPGNAGHRGKHPTSGGVAPVNHAPKPAGVNYPRPGSPGHHPGPGLIDVPAIAIYGVPTGDHVVNGIVYTSSGRPIGGEHSGPPPTLAGLRGGTHPKPPPVHKAPPPPPRKNPGGKRH